MFFPQKFYWVQEDFLKLIYHGRTLKILYKDKQLEHFTIYNFKFYLSIKIEIGIKSDTKV